jgi:hypothetical protein
MQKVITIASDVLCDVPIERDNIVTTPRAMVDASWARPSEILAEGVVPEDERQQR